MARRARDEVLSLFLITTAAFCHEMHQDTKEPEGVPPTSPLPFRPPAGRHEKRGAEPIPRPEKGKEDERLQRARFEPAPKLYVQPKETSN